MKKDVICPECSKMGRRPKVLARYENIAGKGDLYLYCKRCHKEVHIRIEDSLIQK